MSMDSREIIAKFIADTSGFNVDKIIADSEAVEAATARMGTGMQASEQTFSDASAGMSESLSTVADEADASSQGIVDSTANIGSGMDDATQTFADSSDAISGSMGDVADQTEASSQAIRESTSNIGGGMSEAKQSFEESSRTISGSMGTIASETETSSQAIEESTGNIGGGIGNAAMVFEGSSKTMSESMGGVGKATQESAQAVGKSASDWEASITTVSSKYGDLLQFTESFGKDTVTNWQMVDEEAEKTQEAVTSVSRSFAQMGDASSTSSQEVDAVVAEFLGLDGAAGKAGESLKSSGDAAEGAAGHFGNMQMAIMMVVMIGAQLVKSMADQQAQINNTAMAFTTLTGDANKAAQAINNLNSSAAAKDFGAAAVDNATKHLMLLGENSDKASKEVQLVADGIAAVGGSANQIDPVVTQLHNLQDQSKVTTQEIDQIATSGLPAWQALAAGMGTSVEEAQRRVKAGAVTGDQAMKDIMQGLQQYGGSAETQGENLNAEWGRFGDNMGKAFKPIADLLAQDLKAINDLIEGVSVASDAFRAFGQAITSIGLNPLGPLGNFIGHASGIIDSPVGHMALVGEQGPEYMWIPQGASVYPNGTDPFAALSASAPTLAGGMAGGATTVASAQPISVQVYLDSRIMAQQMFPHLAPTIRLLTGSKV